MPERDLDEALGRLAVWIDQPCKLSRPPPPQLSALALGARSERCRRQDRRCAKSSRLHVSVHACAHWHNSRVHDSVNST